MALFHQINWEIGNFIRKHLSFVATSPTAKLNRKQIESEITGAGYSSASEGVQYTSISSGVLMLML